MRSFGNGQTSGLPLLITAITTGTAQTLHTAPVGAATPHILQIFASNIDPLLPHTITVKIVIGGVTRVITQLIPLEPGLFPVLEDGKEIILNGTAVVSVFADAASLVQVTAIVDDQANVAGIASQVIASGLVAAVQNADRFAVGAQGGVGTATEVNANIAMPRSGTLRNLRAVASAAIGGGATVTVAVRVNGVTSALSIPLTVADTTVAVTDTDSVAVAAGDLVTFMVRCDNAGAPAANFHAAVELV